jgi:NADP-dependent 3-hydroxy acid dehydrogenase YdfG
LDGRLPSSVLKQGDKAVMAARKLADIEELAAQYKDNAFAVKLDVTNENDR